MKLLRSYGAGSRSQGLQVRLHRAQCSGSDRSELSTTIKHGRSKGESCSYSAASSLHSFTAAQLQAATASQRFTFTPKLATHSSLHLVKHSLTSNVEEVIKLKGVEPIVDKRPADWNQKPDSVLKVAAETSDSVKRHGISK